MIHQGSNCNCVTSQLFNPNAIRSQILTNVNPVYSLFISFLRFFDKLLIDFPALVPP